MTLEAGKAELRQIEQEALVFLLGHAAQAATGTVAERAGALREKVAAAHVQENAGWPDPPAPVPAMDEPENGEIAADDPEDLSTAERLAQEKPEPTTVMRGHFLPPSTAEQLAQEKQPSDEPESEPAA